MSHVVSLHEINQFLPHTKLDTDAHSDVDGLEETAQAQVFSRLADLYDISGWTGPDDTPVLVRSIIAMLVAGRFYNRQYSEESATDEGYGERRLREAYSLLDGIVDGHYDITDATPTDVKHGEPEILATDPVFVMGDAF